MITYEFTYAVAGLAVAIFALVIVIMAHPGVKKSKSSRN